jgi:hypothetical protein
MEALDGRERLATCPDRFIPEKKLLILIIKEAG